MQTKNALGNLVNRYKAVLSKSHLLNTFGSLAITATLLMSPCSMNTAQAATDIPAPTLGANSAYTLVSGNGGDYTFQIQDANGTATTYSVSLKDFKGGTTQSISDLITSFTSSNGHTIATGSAGTNFTVNGTSYTVTGATANQMQNTSGAYSGNFILQEKATGNGGAILNKATISSIHGDFIVNKASDTATDFGCGGAIQNSTAHIGSIASIKGDFIGNIADTQGGAISNGDTKSSGKVPGTIGTIEGNFIGNRTTDGNTGAIYNLGAITSINGMFIGNSATSHAGALYNFTDGNKPELGTSQITAITGAFIGNTAGKSGGAIVNADGSIIGSITADFIGNTSKSTVTDTGGGAIWNGNGSGGATGSTSTIGSITGDFIANTARSDGGAIFNYTDNSSKSVSIGDITGNFIANNANSDGGAIYNKTANGGTATIGNITGNFIGNSTTNNLGGAIYNYAATIGTIIGDFIDNKGKTTAGAIHNEANRKDSEIGDITGDFIGNKATNGNGGAIYNAASDSYFSCNATIGHITGDFINNSATNAQYGGAIATNANYANNETIINGITGTFSGNVASNTLAVYGGAIANYAGSSNAGTAGGTATITFITGSFTGNHVEMTSPTSDSEANGGALYNGGGTRTGSSPSAAIAIINNISASFVGNYAEANINNPNASAQGGAIYNAAYSDIGRADLTFIANDQTHQFTDNYTNDHSGKDFNAIYSWNGTLTFNMTGSGGFAMNDSILGEDSYVIDIIGEGKNNVFAMNDAMGGFGTMNVTNATLHLGSYTHASADANGTITKASLEGGAGAIITLNNAILAVDMIAFGTDGVQGSTTTTITPDVTSYLLLENIGAGDNQKVLAGFGDVTAFNQDNTKLTTNILTLSSVDTSTAGTLTVSTAINYNSSLIQGPFRDILISAVNNIDKMSTNAGIEFLMNATQNTVGNEHSQGAILQGTAQQSAVSGAPTATYRANRTGAGSLRPRQSSLGGTLLSDNERSGIKIATYNDDGSIKTEYDGVVQVAGTTEALFNKAMDNSIGIWVMPMFSYEDVSGMDAGAYSADFSTDMYGMAVGIDKTLMSTGYFDSYRLGLSFNAGTGQTETSGDFADIQNDFDFVGVNLYGAANKGNYTLSTDFGYTHNASDIHQASQRPSLLPTESDVSADVWHLSFRGEYLHTCDDGAHLLPYVGLDLLTLKSSDYSVKNDKGTLFNVESDRQNVLSVPLGVKYNKTFAHESGWDITPEGKLGAIVSFGDLAEKSFARVPGLDGVANLSMDVIDPVTADFGLGVNAVKDTVRIGLDYGLQVSPHRVGHSLSAAFKVEF